MLKLSSKRNLASALPKKEKNGDGTQYRTSNKDISC